MKHIRTKYRWGSPGNEIRHTTRFTAEQMHHLKALQKLLQAKNYNVSLSVFIRAGVLSLSERIQQELENDTGVGMAVVVRMLEEASGSTTTNTIH